MNTDKSISAFDLIFVNTTDSFEVSGTSSSSALSVLYFE